jgi:hypothetical protein
LRDAAALVAAVGEDVVLDLLGRHPPLVGLAVLADHGGEPSAPVDGDPTHDLGVSEVAGRGVWARFYARPGLKVAVALGLAWIMGRGIASV